MASGLTPREVAFQDESIEIQALKRMAVNKRQAGSPGR